MGPFLNVWTLCLSSFPALSILSRTPTRQFYQWLASRLRCSYKGQLAQVLHKLATTIPDFHVNPALAACCARLQPCRIVSSRPRWALIHAVLHRMRDLARMRIQRSVRPHAQPSFSELLCAPWLLP